MRRLSLVTLLLLGGALNAHADNDAYYNITRHRRGDDALQADTSYCSQALGAPQSGTSTLKGLQELHARARLALQPHRARARDARAYVSRSRQSRTDLQGFCHRRHHRFELFEFLRAGRRRGEHNA
jgi:hypothetical protein